MSEKRDFDFCPRCGALMQNGMCQSCGYGNQRLPKMPNGYPPQNPQNPMQINENPGMSNGYGGGPGVNPTYVYAAPVKQKNHTAAIVISVIAVVILVMGLVIALFVSIANSTRDNVRGENRRSERDTYDDFYDDYYGDYDDDYDYDYDYYEPDEDDPYYREIVDCTRTDLDYSLQWVVESLTPDNSEDDCTFYTTYPILDLEGADQFAKINDTIRELALAYRDSYKECESGISTFGYVTLMDEDKISIVFKHNFYKKNVTEVLLDARTFSIETGEVVSPEEMVEIDLDLAMRFQSQDKLQNDGVDAVQDRSAEELLEILEDPDKAVFFYTPVGLEAGFNYETGWVTVTLKEQAL